MRISQRTRHGSVSMGPVGWFFTALLVGPLWLMWLMLAGAVKLVAWAWREYATARDGRAAPDNRLAPPTRHT